MLKRRSSIKKMALAAGSLTLLPTWAKGWTTQGLDFDSNYSPNEQALLAKVVDTIIPTGDSIGGISVGVDKFLQRLFKDCYETEVQNAILLQLTEMDQRAKTDYGNSLLDCNQSTSLEILEYFASAEDQADTFKLIKSETIRGFRTSKEVMTKFYNYKVMPGHYLGCVDITSS